MPVTEFTDRVSADGSTPYPAEAGRYHLYVSYACPWAQRTIIGRRLKRLEQTIGMSVVDPVRDNERGWAFTGGEYVDHANGFALLREAYEATVPDYDWGLNVPVLWDTETGGIVCNQSPLILRMMSEGFAALGDDSVDLYPEPLRAEIDALNDRIYDTVNKAVYRAGFTRDQGDYEREVATIFSALDELDARLAGRRFLLGAQPVETDWRLFTTLLRFDAVYHVHFKCCLRRLVDYPNLWPYARDLHQWPGVADTVRFHEIRAHYYVTQPWINPSGIVAVMPDADFSEPHGRERLGAAAPHAA